MIDDEDTDNNVDDDADAYDDADYAADDDGDDDEYTILIPIYTHGYFNIMSE